MLENTTVTLPLKGFDRLRAAEREHKEIASKLSSCFAYTCTKNPYPQECEGCPTATDNQRALPRGRAWTIADACVNCAAFQNYNMCNELLTVDVERLIRVAKEYALYNKKDVDTDLDAIPVERVERGGA